MTAVITGDIVASRKLANQEIRLLPLKKLFATRTKEPGIESDGFFKLKSKIRKKH